MDPGENLMDNRHMTDALDRHAQALCRGQDLAASLLAVAAPEERGLLAGLLDVARRAQAGLVYREPPAAFVAQLKAQLAATPRTVPAQPQLPDRRTLVWWAAGVGGVISAAGLGFLAYKVIDNGISGIIAARAARPVLTEAQPSP